MPITERKAEVTLAVLFRQYVSALGSNGGRGQTEQLCSYRYLDICCFGSSTPTDGEKRILTAKLGEQDKVKERERES